MLQQPYNIFHRKFKHTARLALAKRTKLRIAIGIDVQEAVTGAEAAYPNMKKAVSKDYF